MPRELPLFKAFLILALATASAALVLLGPSHAGQMDVFANPVTAEAASSDAPQSPMLEGDHPGSPSTPRPLSPAPASSVEGSGTARADTEGDARRDTPGSATRDTRGNARRDTPGDAKR